MSQPEFDLDDAYGVQTPEDNRALYARWAATYDAQFIVSHGYVYHRGLVDALAERLTDRTGPILDVGCGTGVVGVQLHAQGWATVDGLDLSPEMLAVARGKAVGDSAAYRELFQVDLTQPLPAFQDDYAGLVSAGTFTHGHLGPEPIERLVEVLAPGGVAALGVNAEFFAAEGFEAEIGRLAAASLIENVELVTIPVYDAQSYTAATDRDHIDTKATVVVFERRQRDEA